MQGLYLEALPEPKHKRNVAFAPFDTKVIIMEQSTPAVVSVITPGAESEITDSNNTNNDTYQFSIA